MSEIQKWTVQEVRLFHFISYFSRLVIGLFYFYFYLFFLPVPFLWGLRVGQDDNGTKLNSTGKSKLQNAMQKMQMQKKK